MHIQSKIKPDEFPLEVTPENVLTFEKFVKVECFISKNRITYILHISTVYPQSFAYFHLYPAPVPREGLFKVVIPRHKFLLNSRSHYAYYNEECQEIALELYLCHKESLTETHDNAPCEVKLLNANKTPNTCDQVQIEIEETIVDQLESTNKWILVLPQREVVRMSCPGRQNEARNLEGTFLCQLPWECQLTVSGKTVRNIHEIIKTQSQPVLFPDISLNHVTQRKLNPSIHLPEVKLDDLHELKNEVFQEETQATSVVSVWPSLWTLIIYALLIGCCLAAILKKIGLSKAKNQATHSATNLEEGIQLPRLP
ncbi:uncharacterized protein [Euwallacea fornicatus]|uniref:uncharacterized protein isoform X1 n=1 Tax=Euwallacea fornicatus TaxID=995702 RepID=UPI00338D4C6C